MDIFYPICWSALIAYPISVYALIRWYHLSRLNNTGCGIWLPLALMPLLACIISYVTVVGFFGAFGPGVLMMLCAVPFTLIILLFHFLNWRTFEKAKNDIPRPQWWVRILVVLLIITMSLAPIIGYRVISPACYRLHTVIGEPIVEALDTYFNDKGEYPLELEALVPEYLENTPKPLCLYLNPMLYNVTEYRLEWCPTPRIKEYPIITLMNVAGGFPQRYNLQTREWSSISYFDDICDFRESGN